uniref:Thioredoxin n=1 Tax=Polypedilum vanderplanki TaxID=319348 RepID=S6B7Y5_POLVA|nr:thioredoxin [Polypedilum vanderplanki]
MEMLGNVAKLFTFRSAGSPIRRNITATAKLPYIFKIEDEREFNDKVLNARTPVIVEFFAKWCNLCKMQKPKAEQVVKEFDGKVSLAEVDIDETKEIKEKYGIKTVPVLAVYRDGNIVKILPGMHEADEIKQFIRLQLGE